MELAAIIFVGFLGVCCGQYDTYYCKYLTNANCVTKPEDLQCGTDGNTYYNDCDLSKAHCRDNSLHRKFKGPCPNSAATTTAKPGNVVTNGPTQKPMNGSEIAFNIFCLDLFHHDCTNEVPQVLCASNGQTYQNLCEYEKSKCTHRDLHIVKNAPCTQ
ncbi:follistatin-like [Ostrea edulis]|uniref:follistatin-like n=1 Tax=Ostrea edulis TaxID=37623 RepID=UPI0024AEB8AE|nr:follistatin-like [Ostrea edulis]XP_056021924.1 follistatin-like [Ostrea edulis]